MMVPCLPPQMNTASRMESNGVPGKIHVSKETANELISHGCGSWLIKRDDKVNAKGLGELETFFVQVSAAAKSMWRTATSQ